MLRAVRFLVLWLTWPFLLPIAWVIAWRTRKRTERTLAELRAYTEALTKYYNLPRP